MTFDRQVSEYAPKSHILTGAAVNRIWQYEEFRKINLFRRSGEIERSFDRGGLLWEHRSKPIDT